MPLYMVVFASCFVHRLPVAVLSGTALLHIVISAICFPIAFHFSSLNRSQLYLVVLAGDPYGLVTMLLYMFVFASCFVHCFPVSSSLNRSQLYLVVLAGDPYGLDTMLLYMVVFASCFVHCLPLSSSLNISQLYLIVLAEDPYGLDTMPLYIVVFTSCFVHCLPVWVLSIVLQLYTVVVASCVVHCLPVAVLSGTSLLHIVVSAICFPIAFQLQFSQSISALLNRFGRGSLWLGHDAALHGSFCELLCPLLASVQFS